MSSTPKRPLEPFTYSRRWRLAGYERIASPGCSDRTIRRRVHEWAVAGLSEQLHTLALRAYDQMLGLDLARTGWPKRRRARSTVWSSA
jgi:hypothetical protein